MPSTAIRRAYAGRDHRHQRQDHDVILRRRAARAARHRDHRHHPAVLAARRGRPAEPGAARDQGMPAEMRAGASVVWRWRSPARWRSRWTVRLRRGRLHNLTQDHLDFHGTFEEHRRAKRLFELLAVSAAGADRGGQRRRPAGAAGRRSRGAGFRSGWSGARACAPSYAPRRSTDPHDGRHAARAWRCARADRRAQRDEPAGAVATGWRSAGARHPGAGCERRAGRSKRSGRSAFASWWITPTRPTRWSGS
jgi:hypothetical protein